MEDREEWKVKMKRVKEEKKKQKKLEKEEEVRKLRSGPKDSKVVLIDGATLGKLWGGGKAAGAQAPAAFRAGDFPQLSAPPPPPQKPAKLLNAAKAWSRITDTPWAKPADSFPALETSLQSPRRKPPESPPMKPEDSFPTLETTLPPPRKKLPGTSAKPEEDAGAPRNAKKKRRKDPIIVDLSSVLVVKKQNKKEKQLVLGSKYRKKTAVQLSGNMLDASNPKRNKGKHREHRRTKLTKLKTAVVTERILKMRKEKEIDLSELKKEIASYLERSSELRKQRERGGNVPKCPQATKVAESKKDSPERTEKAGDKPLERDTDAQRYCDNMLTSELRQAAEELLREVVHLQDRMHARDPTKARAKRRFVSGFREAAKYLRLKKVKMVMVAPDLEKCETPGGVNELVAQLKSDCACLEVPCLFALDRRKLGYTCMKKVPVSVVALLSVDGVETRFAKVVQELETARSRLAELEPPSPGAAGGTGGAREEDCVTSSVISSLLSALTEGDPAGSAPGVDSDNENDNPFLQALGRVDPAFSDPTEAVIPSCI